ncbi:MAG: M20/M25/M40 family metallo-hydrolase [Acidimicrobiia bacterium]|nr:M20/M25/M40 family metallo-hydrolase [Acidimicrobiia bacterium]
MRINTVPAHAEIDVDVRIPDASAGEEIHAAIEAAVVNNHVDGCSARWILLNERPPMVPQSPDVDSVVAQLQEAARQLGYHLEATATGGGSDGAFTSALGVPTLDALGAVGGWLPHKQEEFVTQSSLVERAAAFGAFWLDLGKVECRTRASRD